MILSRKQRLAAKAAKTGVETYGSVKQTQGRIEGRRASGGRGGRGFVLGLALGAGAVYAVIRGEAKTAAPGGTPPVATP